MKFRRVLGQMADEVPESRGAVDRVLVQMTDEVPKGSGADGLRFWKVRYR